MKFYLQVLAAILITLLIASIIVDFNKEKAFQTILVWIIGFSPIILGAINLYFDKGLSVTKDASGNLEPIYRSKINRRKTLSIRIIVGGSLPIIIYLLFSIAGIDIDDMILVISIVLVPVGAYFFMTNKKCPYCYTSNGPQDLHCNNCGSSIDEEKSI